MTRIFPIDLITHILSHLEPIHLPKGLIDKEITEFMCKMKLYNLVVVKDSDVENVLKGNFYPYADYVRRLHILIKFGNQYNISEDSLDALLSRFGKVKELIFMNLCEIKCPKWDVKLIASKYALNEIILYDSVISFSKLIHCLRKMPSVNRLNLKKVSINIDNQRYTIDSVECIILENVHFKPCNINWCKSFHKIREFRFLQTVVPLVWLHHWNAQCIATVETALVGWSISTNISYIKMILFAGPEHHQIQKIAHFTAENLDITINGIPIENISSTIEYIVANARATHFQFRFPVSGMNLILSNCGYTQPCTMVLKTHFIVYLSCKINIMTMEQFANINTIAKSLSTTFGTENSLASSVKLFIE